MDFSKDTFYGDIFDVKHFDWKYIYIYMRYNFGVTRRLLVEIIICMSYLGDTRSK